jgi:hypothetical protein
MPGLPTGTLALALPSPGARRPTSARNRSSALVRMG